MTLLSMAFWFNLRPGSMPSLNKNILIGLIIALFLAAIVLFIAKRKKSFYKKMFSNLYDFAVTNAVIGLLLLFFNYELVPFFSARFWFLIWAVISIWWLVYVLKELKQIPARKKQSEVTDEIKKYLP